MSLPRRLLAALARVRAALESSGAEVELIALEPTAVRLRLSSDDAERIARDEVKRACPELMCITLTRAAVSGSAEGPAR
jgi:hypothetical protein